MSSFGTIIGGADVLVGIFVLVCLAFIFLLNVFVVVNLRRRFFSDA